MAYWSIAILIISLSFLIRRHTGAIMNYLPAWLRPQVGQVDEPGRDELDKDVDQTRLLQSETPSHSAGGSERDNVSKAETTNLPNAIPAVSLTEDTIPSPAPSQSVVNVTRAQNSPPHVSAILPAPTPLKQGLSNLMPPPALPSTAYTSATGSPASQLRIPTTGPLPNRGPPLNSQQRASGGLTANGPIPSTKSRGKVLLSPGHSPMDWAALTRSGNLSGVANFQRVTPSTLKQMTGRKGKPAWTSWQGKVYNFTPYLPFHPGGEPELMKAAGRDATQLFMEVHPWVNFENMLGSCLVGVMVPENYDMGRGEGSLEDMD